ncbi:GNAT family N-acetyltransferase [Clostridium sp.]|uniref:GNAT family N-acetyltransferase n=1 Tax=Clostridium sp. TaxID=1506 RepID=UPI003F3D31CB
MNIITRREVEKDFNNIYKLVEESFKTAEHADGNEQDLVNKLRNSNSYINELSLVAMDEDKIVGHIMFTKAFIESENNKVETLALAPLAVSPEYQGKGVGSKLINDALNIAKGLGYNSVIVLGSEKYYPRFGFKEAKSFGVNPSFEVPSANFMALELNEDSLRDVNGTMIYAKEFFE